MAGLQVREHLRAPVSGYVPRVGQRPATRRASITTPGVLAVRAQPRSSLRACKDGQPTCQADQISDQVSSAIRSARGCQAAATRAVVWNNSRLHTPDREKIWVACGEHKQPLADYLAARSFLKRVERLGAGF